MDAHQDSAGGESNRTKTEAEELIAELCIKCDDDDVKQVLKKYQYGYSIPDIEKRMKQGPASNLPHLIKALKFLNNTAIPNKIPTRKDDVIHRIVCRMQNLLPDDCPFCKTRFKSQHDEKPILQCAKCGQNCHRSCIIGLLKSKLNCDLTNENELDQEQIQKLINPLSFPGIHYLCKLCEEDVVPSELLRTYPDERNEEIESEPVDTAPDNSIIEKNIPLPSTSTELSTNGTSTSNADASSNIPPSDTTSTKKAIEKNPVTCRYYKKSACRHGIKGEECRFTHPELCQKYIQHGTRQPRGCIKGASCKYLHPQMCIDSLRKGKCLSQSCRYRHVKGTTRHETDGKANVHIKANNAPQLQQAVVNENENAQKQTVNTGNFLDAIRLLKADLLEEMDKRINMIVQARVQQPPATYFQQMPHTMPPQMLQIQRPQQQQHCPTAFNHNKKTQQQQFHQQPLSLPIQQTQQIALQPINQHHQQ